MKTATQSTPSRSDAHWKLALKDGCAVPVERVAVGIVLVGLLARLAQYAANRSLWLDEALLALNVLRRSPADLLLGTLDWNQAAPAGVLALLKLSTAILGPGEYALRLWPLIAGLLTVPLFWVLARRLLEPRAALVSLALFALSDSLIYFASETKQYSSDVLCALLAYLAVLAWTARWPHAAREAIVAALAGAGLIWFSHPVIFVLAGVGLALTAEQLWRRDWRRVGQLAAVGTVWALSFLGVYVLNLSKLASPFLEAYWQAAFMPWPPVTPSGLLWLVRTGAAAFVRPFGLVLHDQQNVVNLAYAAVPATACLLGLIGLARRDLRTLALLLTPALLALLASAAHRYPIHGRFLLFLAPSVMLLIGAGALYLWQRLAASRPFAWRAALLVLLAPPLGLAVYRLAVPRTVEELRPPLAQLLAERAPGEALYAYSYARYAVDYYAATLYPELVDYAVLPFACRTGDPPAELTRSTERQAVWVVFSHVLLSDGDSAEQCWIRRLDALADRSRAFQAPDASVYRYQPR